MEYYYWLLIGGIIVLITAVASRYASNYGISSLLITLFIGLFLGNGYDYDFSFNYPLPTLRISELALCVIIFAGGFDSKWKKIKPVAIKGGILASVGVIITAICLGVFVYFAFDWPIYSALLLGTILSSTDAAAVFSILEHSKLKLKRGLSSILQFESGTNDPIAFLLTFIFIELALGHELSLGYGILIFIQSIALGLLSGWVAAKLILFAGPKINLKRGQAPMALLTSIVIIYASNMIVGGSPFLAMYVFGIILGNSPWQNREVNMNFFESLSWLMETLLFLLLGLQVFLQNIYTTLEIGVIIALVLIFIARPIAVFIGLSPYNKMKVRDKLFISWVGLRGATPIVFGLMALVHETPYADLIFSISFIVVVTSILLQGQTTKFMAHWLKVSEKE